MMEEGPDGTLDSELASRADYRRKKCCIPLASDVEAGNVFPKLTYVSVMRS